MKKTSLYLLSIFFIVAGINHFIMPNFYLRMMPDYLPYPLELIYISGVIEVLLGFGVLINKYQNLAKWGLIALLIAIFPANLSMAMHPEKFPEFSPLGLWLRLPFQFLFIAWVVYATTSPRNH